MPLHRDTVSDAELEMVYGPGQPAPSPRPVHASGTVVRVPSFITENRWVRDLMIETPEPCGTYGSALDAVERRAWTAYSRTVTPTFTTTSTTTNMTNYVAIATATASGTVTWITTSQPFNQPLTRLYAATSGTVIAGPYVGFDEAEAMALWAASCRAQGGRVPPLPSRGTLWRRRKQKQHAGRRALRRSIDIYAKMRGMDEITQFLRGQQIVLPGCAFDYRVRKTKGVLAHSIDPAGGHIPYRLEIARKETPPDAPGLAHGCIYIDRTPVIDQILALSLHVSDPDEEKRVIRTANWTPYRNCDRAARSLLHCL